jgi:RNA polymerase sigma-70 factor (sigma-E family)
VPSSVLVLMMMSGSAGGTFGDHVFNRSFTALYERYADDAIGLAYLLTGDRRLAEDLMQEAFVRVARRFVHIRDPDAFWGYLRRSVVNLANSHFRRRAIERGYLARQPKPEEASETDPSDRVVLREAILRLPLRQRTALVLRFYEDLPEREIADLMSCRAGAVKQLVFRAMQTLRRDVAGWEEP